MQTNRLNINMQNLGFKHAKFLIQTNKRSRQNLDIFFHGGFRSEIKSTRTAFAFAILEVAVHVEFADVHLIRRSLLNEEANVLT